MPARVWLEGYKTQYSTVFPSILSLICLSGVEVSLLSYCLSHYLIPCTVPFCLGELLQSREVSSAVYCRRRGLVRNMTEKKTAAQRITRNRNSPLPPTSTHQPINPPTHQFTKLTAYQPINPKPLPPFLSSSTNDNPHSPNCYERQPALHKLLRTTTRTPKTSHFFRPSSISSTMSSIVSQLAIKLHADKKSIVGSINLRTNFHLSR
jgi:hypothetical protein